MSDKLDAIRKRWPTNEAFYCERDHRTQVEVRNLPNYVRTPVEIHVDPEFAEDVTIQRIVLLVANLTARWARDIRVLTPEVELAAPFRGHDGERLHYRIKREMFEADPFGDFRVGEIDGSNSGSLRLYIGPCSGCAVTQADYVVDASGWTVLGRRGRSFDGYQRETATAPAAGLAAAIGSADLFKRAIGHRANEWIGEVKWCTWNHADNGEGSCATPRIPTALDLGDVLVAGIGAIGSALLYILSWMPLQGHIAVLDRDCVETSNLNRSPLFTALDAATSRNKVDVARTLLSSSGIEVETLEGAWRTHGERLGRSRFDVWVSLTNEDGAWAEVPFHLPPIVLHGTTTSGWGIGFGRHIPRVEDCTACRLPRPHAQFRGPCAEGEVSSPDRQEPVRASLPFLSTASAALIATELLKLRFPQAPSLPNAVYADFRLGLPAIVATLIGPNLECGGCKMAALPLWSERGGRSRYAGFSVGCSDGG
jgi:hypothetical protein